MTADNTQNHQSIEQLLRLGTSRLSEAGIENPRREVRLLLQHALGQSAEQMLARSARDAVPAALFLSWLERRAAHEPFAYITGSKGFWSLDLAVSGASLVPRADTETLVSCVLEYCPDHGRSLSVRDLGTGSGCLLLAVLAEYPAAWGVGVDINPQAAGLARLNAERSGLAGRAVMMAGEWVQALADHARFDVVLSNPPYIPTQDLQTLMPEVREHEPIAALDGGADGLDAYRVLCQRLPSLLAPGGIGVFEIGIGQEPALRELAAQAGLSVVAVQPDLGGIPRAVVLRAVAS
ncbi:MAG: peptide chain release factor N(5)-glutamine methyltransferase [Acetobacter sp.]